MAKYLVESIGTFFLMTTIGMVAVGPDEAKEMAPLAIGALLTAMVYAGGHISGAHYNPAVTMAFWMRGKCSLPEVPFYMLSQFMGAALAAGAVVVMKGDPQVHAITLDPFRALVAELCFTFALAYVILNVATARNTEGNPYFGLAIGFVVLGGAYAVGPVSGGAFNPAVALGITILGISPILNIWIYLVGTFGGAAAAAVAFRFINPEDV